MTIVKLGDSSIVLEKVVAFELLRGNLEAEADGSPSLQVMLEGGHVITIKGRPLVQAFMRAIQGFNGV